MNSRKKTALEWFASIIFIGALLVPRMAVAQQEGVEVMTRGPVHEAFAGTVSYNPEPGIIVSARVPAMIEEVPPEQRPEGDNIAWIPGYWASDEEQNDFLWISGVWRNLPPGRQWVPGYWADIEGGHQWTSGYWEDAETTQVTYLPEPPRSLEVGPNIAAPSNNYSWIPGNWMWSDTRYAWRSGYWSPARTNWIWVPGCYRWTRYGYNYVGGYWDYAVAGRGVLFAPVYFRGNVWNRPGYFYSPSTVISLAVFSNHLFLRPNYGHYYFGDYYAPLYRNRGFYASYSYNSSRYGCDPIYSHYRWENRHVPNWDRSRRDYYQHRRDHENARPPRTLAGLNSLSASQRGRGSDYAVAEPLSRYAKSHGDGRKRFQTVGKQDRQRIQAQTQDIRKFGRERKQLETRRDTTTVAAGRTRAGREKVNRSPLYSTVNERSDKSVAPPQRLERRASGRDQGTARTSKPGNVPRPARETQAMPDTGKNRVSPPEKKARTDRQTATRPERKVQPEPTRRGTPSSVVRKPETGSQAIQRPGRQTAPEVKRQPVPSPTRQAAPGPTRKIKPEPSRQTKFKPSRVATPAPTRQAVPAPRKAEPAPVRRAEPAPTRQARPQRSIPQPSSRAVPTPSQRRQIQRVQPQRAPQPQKTQRIQPQRAPQKAAPQRSSSKPSNRSDTSRSEDTNRGGRRR